jgi:hypothetical protein
MTGSPVVEPQTELSREQALVRYLEAHPDFFERHPQLLAQLKLAHEPGGRAVSLIERQVLALRGREQTLARELDELLAIARDNDLTTQRLHRFALAMLEALTLDEALDVAAELLRQEFALDAVAIRLRAPAGVVPARPELVPANDPHLAALLQQLHGARPLCGARLDEPQRIRLFGNAGREVRSLALIPLGGKLPHGVLALGSSDAQRFHASQGTLYLTRLGELLTEGLARHARAAAR